MKVVIAIDSLKDSLTSFEAGKAAEKGIRRAYGDEDVNVVIKPLADGGEGTVEALVTGMKMSDGNMDHPQTKRECYKMMQKLTEEFTKKNSSIVCSEIKGVHTGQVLRSCDGCIEDAVELLDKYLLGIEE